MLVAIASLASEWPDWTTQARAGGSWARIQQSLGAPTYQAANLQEATRLARGFAAPSPLRYRHSGPVAIYARGEYALWVFRDGDVVTATFVGGS